MHDGVLERKGSGENVGSSSSNGCKNKRDP